MEAVDFAGGWTTSLRNLTRTKRLAQMLAAQLRPGMVVALTGSLGAGKTSFVQGLAAGLTVRDVKQVVSPTYTLLNEYPTQAGPWLLHFDFYRLQDAESACALGLDEQIGRPDAISAVEWADHLPSIIPAHAVWIHLMQAESGRLCQVIGLAQPDKWQL